MKKVILIYVIDEHGKNMIGVSDSVDDAIKFIKKTAYGYDITEEEYALLAILGYTTNFKLETWEVH